MPMDKALPMPETEMHSPEQSGLKLPRMLSQLELEKYRTHSPRPLRQESLAYTVATRRAESSRSFILLWECADVERT